MRIHRQKMCTHSTITAYVAGMDDECGVILVSNALHITDPFSLVHAADLRIRNMDKLAPLSG
jgi:hypothetical protein